MLSKIFLAVSTLFLIPSTHGIGEGIMDLDNLAGIFTGLGELFETVNTTEVDIRYMMGKWHQMYKAAINFDVFRTQMYCPVSYFKQNFVMGPEGFSIDEAYHVISKAGPIETYLKDVSKTGSGQFWVYPHQYFYPHQFYIIHTGPIVNGSYQYMIATDSNKLALTVLARDPQDFYQKYDKEVLELLSSEKFGQPVFWNQPVAIYHGPDCYYPTQQEVFARRVLQDMVRQKQPQQQTNPIANPLQAIQSVVGGIGAGQSISRIGSQFGGKR